jgi:hypothetical protein
MIIGSGSVFESNIYNNSQQGTPETSTNILSIKQSDSGYLTFSLQSIQSSMSENPTFALGVTSLPYTLEKAFNLTPELVEYLNLDNSKGLRGFIDQLHGMIGESAKLATTLIQDEEGKVKDYTGEEPPSPQTLANSQNMSKAMERALEEAADEFLRLSESSIELAQGAVAGAGATNYAELDNLEEIEPAKYMASIAEGFETPYSQAYKQIEELRNKDLKDKNIKETIFTIFAGYMNFATNDFADASKVLIDTNQGITKYSNAASDPEESPNFAKLSPEEINELNSLIKEINARLELIGSPPLSLRVTDEKVTVYQGNEEDDEISFSLDIKIEGVDINMPKLTNAGGNRR